MHEVWGHLGGLLHGGTRYRWPGEFQVKRSELSWGPECRGADVGVGRMRAGRGLRERFERVRERSRATTGRIRSERGDECWEGRPSWRWRWCVVERRKRREHQMEVRADTVHGRSERGMQTQTRATTRRFASRAQTPRSSCPQATSTSTSWPVRCLVPLRPQTAMTRRVPSPLPLLLSSLILPCFLDLPGARPFEKTRIGESANRQATGRRAIRRKSESASVSDGHS